MSLSVAFYIGGLAQIREIRAVQNDKSRVRVRLSVMGCEDEVVVPADMMSQFKVLDFVVVQFEAKQVQYVGTYDGQSYVRRGYELGMITLLRKPTKEEF